MISKEINSFRPDTFNFVKIIMSKDSRDVTLVVNEKFRINAAGFVFVSKVNFSSCRIDVRIFIIKTLFVFVVERNTLGSEIVLRRGTNGYTAAWQIEIVYARSIFRNAVSYPEVVILIDELEIHSEFEFEQVVSNADAKGIHTCIQ